MLTELKSCLNGMLRLLRLLNNYSKVGEQVRCLR